MYHALTDVLPRLAANKVLIVTDSEYVYKEVLGGGAEVETAWVEGIRWPSCGCIPMETCVNAVGMCSL